MIFLSGLKENNFVQNFINELSNYLENSVKNSLDYRSEEVPIIEDILSKNNVTTDNENSIRWKFDDVISKYAEQNLGNDSIYFVISEIPVREIFSLPFTSLLAFDSAIMILPLS